MANRERGEVILAVRGEPYTLALTTAGACELEAAAGQSFDTIVAGVQQARSLQHLRWLLWAGLQVYHQGRIRMPDDAGDLIDAAGGHLAVWPQVMAWLTLNADQSPPPAKGRVADPFPRNGTVWARLYVDARCLGLSGAEFWALRLRELWLELEAGRRLERRDYERDVMHAYLTEYMARQEKFS